MTGGEHNEVFYASIHSFTYRTTASILQIISKLLLVGRRKLYLTFFWINSLVPHNFFPVVSAKYSCQFLVVLSNHSFTLTPLSNCMSCCQTMYSRHTHSKQHLSTKIWVSIKKGP